MGRLVATCVWEISPELLIALDDRFGPPVDSYVNGSQVWLREDGPAGETIEWRLHPTPEFHRPDGAGVHDLFDLVAVALATGEDPVGPPASLWDGLEAYSAYGDELEPAVLAGSCRSALGQPPTASGLVDHKRIGDDWERAGGRTSIVGALLAELSNEPTR